ncbi:hypothetical protein HER10_EVM0010561 [Colletotrichum scovillei]|uniref:uncharacterized protein n=1 Tax=Colletotrichum scovillei TaxID=1209932 RepID=UPI0015C2EAF3|nr:uncharacterized protein HER10_EVM0010561 [Colletotrichum scovillei]KAF4772827.1 hypothetical protein HER10_EVM0010561 [Colletotrichum scovillei]
MQQPHDEEDQDSENINVDTDTNNSCHSRWENEDAPPRFYRVSLSLSFPRSVDDSITRHVALCFHDDWLLTPLSSSASASETTSHTVHFYCQNQVSLCSELNDDDDATGEDGNPYHADGCGRSFTVDTIHLPACTTSSPSDPSPELSSKPEKELPSRRGTTLKGTLVMVMTLLMAFFLLYTVYHPQSVFSFDAYGSSPSRYRSRMLDTRHMLSHVESVSLSLLPLRFHHHDLKGNPCDIWWPADQLLSYSLVTSKLSNLARHVHSTKTSPITSTKYLDAFKSLADNARDAAVLLQAMSRTDHTTWESNLILLLVNVRDDLDSMPAPKPTPKFTTTTYDQYNTSTGALAQSFLGYLKSSHKNMDAWVRQLKALEHHLHKSQLLQDAVIHMLVDMSHNEVVSPGHRTPKGSESGSGSPWWSEDIVFYVKLLTQELAPRRDAVRGLVNEALMTLEAARETVGTSLDWLAKTAVQADALTAHIIHAQRRLRELESAAAARDAGAKHVRHQITVDPPLRRRLFELDRAAKHQWAWVSAIWPMDDGLGLQAGAEDGGEPEPGKPTSGSSVGLCHRDVAHHGEWVTSTVTTKAAERSATAQPQK